MDIFISSLIVFVSGLCLGLGLLEVLVEAGVQDDGKHDADDGHGYVEEHDELGPVRAADAGEQAGDGQDGVVGDGGGYHDDGGHDRAVFGEHGDGHAGHELQYAARGKEAHQEARRVAYPGLGDHEHGNHGDDGCRGVDDEDLRGLEALGQERRVHEEREDDADGVEALHEARVGDAVGLRQLLIAVEPDHEGGGGGEAEDDEDDGAGGELHALLLLALDLDAALIGREGQEDEGYAGDGDEGRAEEEDGGVGQSARRDKADGEGQQELGDGDGELGEDVRDGALFLEYLHAGGGDADVEEAVGRAGDDAEYVGQHVAARVADRGEEDEVERAAHEGGDPASEAVGDGAGEGVADEAAEAQRRDDREHAGDVVGAVGEQAAAPEGRQLLLVLAHDGAGHAEDEVGHVQREGRGVVLFHAHLSRPPSLICRWRRRPRLSACRGRCRA